MATKNLAGNEQQEPVKELLCSAELPHVVHGKLTFIAVLNSFLSFTAFLGNALVLIALHKESSHHPPSKLLLRCLATTDLCVGLTSLPLSIVTYCRSIVSEHWNMCRYASVVCFTTANIFCVVPVLTRTANRRGQTSRPVVGTEILTRGNLKTNLHDGY